MPRRKPARKLPPTNNPPLHGGDSPANRKRRVVEHTKHHRKKGNAQ